MWFDRLTMSGVGGNIPVAAKGPLILSWSSEGFKTNRKNWHQWFNNRGYPDWSGSGVLYREGVFLPHGLLQGEALKGYKSPFRTRGVSPSFISPFLKPKEGGTGSLAQKLLWDSVFREVRGAKPSEPALSTVEGTGF